MCLNTHPSSRRPFSQVETGAQMGPKMLGEKVQGRRKVLASSLLSAFISFPLARRKLQNDPLHSALCLALKSLGVEQCSGSRNQRSFPSPPAMAKLMISNLQITGKEKAHTFITHTSLSPKLGGVRQLGPHSCHLHGQRPCQASLPL